MDTADLLVQWWQHIWTVAFPNPEEPGAMDLAHDLGSRVDADLVIANDPDADRLAVSLPDGAGGWRQLTGNQIGTLLGDFVLENGLGADRLVVESVVSSPMLAAVADHHGVRCERTLTGFKWICNAGLALEEEGQRMVFGYEEALGYAVGTAVRDKDGMSAALAFVRMAAASRAAGESVLDRLGRLYRRDGLWVSMQKSIVRTGEDGAAEIDGAMSRLADERPKSLGGFDVTEVIDYRIGADARPSWLGATALVEYLLGSSGRALIRPSGTEPKIKIYVDLRGDTGDDWQTAERLVLDRARTVAEDLATFAGF
jgi:phosphomannomutase